MSVNCLPPAVTVTVVCGSATSCEIVYADGDVTSPLTDSTGLDPLTPLSPLAVVANAGTETAAETPRKDPAKPTTATIIETVVLLRTTFLTSVLTQ